VFLDCSGSWTKAAEAMFVHVNSLRYRIRRVEELTGRDLGSLADQAALLLALRLAEDQGTDPGGGGGVEAGRFPAG
jgi:DNA-binding PucR family transcriptional regulator